VTNRVHGVAIISFDAGYTGKPVAKRCASMGLASRCDERDSKPRPKRTAVECAHSKFNRFRGIKVRVLRLTRRWQALLELAAAIITFRATSHRLATST